MPHDERTRRALRRLNDPELNFYRLSIVILIFVGGIIAINDAIDQAFPNWATHLKQLISAASHSIAALCLGVAIFFGLSLLLFLFKKRSQFYYGVVETVVSIIGLIKMTQGLQQNSIDLVGFFAALYLCVRGINNADDGRRDENWPNTFAGKNWAKWISKRQKQTVEVID